MTPRTRSVAPTAARRASSMVTSGIDADEAEGLPLGDAEELADAVAVGLALALGDALGVGLGVGVAGGTTAITSAASRGWTRYPSDPVPEESRWPSTPITERVTSFSHVPVSMPVAGLTSTRIGPEPSSISNARPALRLVGAPWIWPVRPMS